MVRCCRLLLRPSRMKNGMKKCANSNSRPSNFHVCGDPGSPPNPRRTYQGLSTVVLPIQMISSGQIHIRPEDRECQEEVSKVVEPRRGCVAAKRFTL